MLGHIQAELLIQEAGKLQPGLLVQEVHSAPSALSVQAALWPIGTVCRCKQLSRRVKVLGRWTNQVHGVSSKDLPWLTSPWQRRPPEHLGWKQAALKQQIEGQPDDGQQPAPREHHVALDGEAMAANGIDEVAMGLLDRRTPLWIVYTGPEPSVTFARCCVSAVRNLEMCGDATPEFSLVPKPLP
jgi:hypothetical protein